MRWAIIFGATLILSGCDQHADTRAQTAAQCFHVSFSRQGVSPNTAMRWNSCTGDSWVLLYTEYPNGNHAWAWHAVGSSTVP